MSDFAKEPAPDATGKCGELVTVKDLAWEPDIGKDGECICDIATTPFGQYYVERDTFGYSPTPTYYASGPNGFRQQFSSDREAFAAAQENFNCRILSVVTRSQAEELLAAERAEKEAWRKAAIEHQKRAKGLEADASRWHQKAMDAGVIVHSDGTTSHPMRKERDDLKADNAALTARVKADELKILKLEERLSAEQASHEQSGKSRDEWRGKAEALEAKLAAANEVAQLVIQAEEDKSGDPNFYILMMQTAYDKARAVLGGKPSC